jgi:hypothetical protein
MQVAVAAGSISPYRIITQDMVKLGDTITVRDAQARGAYPLDSVVGLMSVSLITPGDMITGVNAKPVEDVRFVGDMALEIVSFQVSVDRVVGGKVRPGHVINLYGTGRDDADPFTILIEPRLWVVGVSSGGRPVTDATPQPDAVTGELHYIGGERDMPSTLITVAVPPREAVNIIHELGSRRLDPYVTLAASSTWQMPATPGPGIGMGGPIGTVPTAIMSLRTPTPYATIADDGYGTMAGESD